MLGRGQGSEKIPGNLLEALQLAVHNYLNESPTRSLNKLSRKCSVSESTLRRIYKGQIKTLPTSTTILDILTKITGESSAVGLAKAFPGPIEEYLQSHLPHLQDCHTEYNSELNAELKDSVKYIIYKLASNKNGLSYSKLKDLFGSNGYQQAQDLVEKEYLILSENIFYSKVKNFTVNQDSFVGNFKLIADFIKTQNPLVKNHLHALLANYSESVSPEAYKEIVSLQKKMLQKIRHIMSDEKSQGTIPLFLLLAIDTIDSKTAQELSLESSHSSQVESQDCTAH